MINPLTHETIMKIQLPIHQILLINEAFAEIQRLITGTNDQTYGKSRKSDILLVTVDRRHAAGYASTISLRSPYLSGELNLTTASLEALLSLYHQLFYITSLGETCMFQNQEGHGLAHDELESFSLVYSHIPGKVPFFVIERETQYTVPVNLGRVLMKRKHTATDVAIEIVC